MHLLIYASAVTPVGRSLLKKIPSAVKNAPVDFFDSLDCLTQYLRTPITAERLAVLLPKTNKELASLIQMRHLLRDMRIVLILPNRDDKTISDSHILRPRYVSYSDGDMSDVAAVVQKMATTEKTYFMRTG